MSRTYIALHSTDAERLFDLTYVVETFMYDKVR